MINDLKEFFLSFSQVVFPLSGEMENKFQGYAALLGEWRTRVNLVSRKEDDIVHRHFSNSALVAYYIRFKENDRVIDVGSGAGFPGVILAILFPGTPMILVESTTKKTNFLSAVARELNLDNITIENARAEEISGERRFRGSFSHVTARAVAPLPKLVELTQTFLQPDGKFLFLKGRSVTTELSLVQKNLRYEMLPFSEIPMLGQHQDGVLWVGQKSTAKQTA